MAMCISKAHFITKRIFKVSLLHGVTTVVTDPHEIGNIAGSTGLEFMIEDARQTLMNIFLCYLLVYL